MPIYFDKARARWRFEFDRIIGGRRSRITKLLPKGWSRAQAEAYDRSQGHRLYAVATGLEQPRLSLAGAVKLYLEHRCPDLKNGVKAAQDLAQLLPEIEAADLSEVSDLATRYEIAQRGKFAPATIRNRLAYLKAAVRYAYKKHNYGDRDYTDRMSMPTVRNERQVYARLPQLKALWKELKDPDARAIFRLAFYCGLRWRAELLPRTAADVRRNGDDVWLYLGKTKSGAERMKWVHPEARGDLRHLPFARGYAAYYTRFREARAAIGRTDLNPHDLRHSLASVIVSDGGTLTDVQEALHHESIQSSRRYAHLYPERMKTVLSGIGRKKIPTQRTAMARYKAPDQMLSRLEQRRAGGRCRRLRR